jgi:hypothetical protein
VAPALLVKDGYVKMSRKSENDGPGFVFMGANVDEQWKAAASKAPDSNATIPGAEGCI